MAVLSGIIGPQAGEVLCGESFTQRPLGFESTQDSAKVSLAAHCRLMQERYAKHWLAAENAALREQLQLQMGSTAAAVVIAAAEAQSAAAVPALWCQTSCSKTAGLSSAISTEPPSDADHDIDEVLIPPEFENGDASPEEEAVALDSNANVSDTTIHMRNVPQSFARKDLMDLLDGEGFGCRYTFLYLPIDLTSGDSLGFAFVTLESEQTCREFLGHFLGFRDWDVGGMEQACHVEKTKDATHGLNANIERYRNSRVMHESVPDACKPVLLARGVRVAFPPPTVAVRHGPRPRR